jgi:hypothetical protein
MSSLKIAEQVIHNQGRRIIYSLLQFFFKQEAQIQEKMAEACDVSRSMVQTTAKEGNTQNNANGHVFFVIL